MTQDKPADSIDLTALLVGSPRQDIATRWFGGDVRAADEALALLTQLPSPRILTWRDLESVLNLIGGTP